jgi:DNA repair exonuclease SbcCD nuclease subunit
MTTGNSSNLKIAVASDIHLGHARNPTERIIKNLRAAFPDNAETAELDMIVLAGDVFDTHLSLPDDVVTEIKVWVTYMLRLCKKHDILLRVLEGTPSHDWKQSKIFQSLNEVTGIGADLKYVRNLSIEYEERHDMWLLFVPDEWTNSTETTLSQVHDLLRAKGLTHVDYAFMHGQFEYQLPPHVKAQKHSSEEYLKIVKHLIFIGHVHIHSRYERIIAQGSFDRLSHGEEGPKGHVRAYRRGDESDVVFFENEAALRFVTVKCEAMTLEDTLAEIAKQVQALPPDSFVRVQATYDNPIFSNMDALVRKWPWFTWDKKPIDDGETEAAETMVDDEVSYIPITITRDNVTAMLTDRLINSGAPSDVLAMAQEIMPEVL